MVFYGDATGDLQELITRYDVGSMARHGGRLGQQDTYAAQKSADLLLFLEHARPSVDGILTGKLFEYLYVDTPVLGVGITPESAPGRMIVRAGAGHVVGTSVEAVQDTLMTHMEGRADVRRDREFISGFSRRGQVERLAATMQGLRG